MQTVASTRATARTDFRSIFLPGDAAGGPGVDGSAGDLNLSLYFHRDVEWQLRHAHRTPTVCTHIRTKHLENEVRKTIHDTRLLVEARRRVHHAEHPRPRCDAIEIPERALQATEYGQRRQSRCHVPLLESEITPDFAERPGKRTVRGLRTMA